jgi:hypothetical protein
MIFILGNSHCGSTLLSFLLASHPQIINLGELKTKTWIKDRFCSCGKPADQCSFYGDYFGTFNSLKQRALVNPSPLRFLWRNRIPLSSSTQTALHSFYSSLQDRLHFRYPYAAAWIDSSKSIWMLNAWLSILPQDDIRIIWLRRHPAAIVSSFIKRGSSFLKAFSSVLLNDQLTRKFIRANKLQVLEVHYDRFYKNWEEEAHRLSAFLHLDIPAVYSVHDNHHVISGNAKTRIEFANDFKGVRKDEEWLSILTPYQQKLIAWYSGA